MYYLFSFLLCTIALAIVGIFPAKAQQGSLLYPFVGYRYDALPALNRKAGHLNIVQAEGTGTTYNHTGIVGIDILSPIPVLANLRGSFHAGLEFSTGNFSSNPYSSGEAIDPVTSLPTASVNTFSMDVSSVSFHLGVRITAPIMEQMSVFGGMWTSWLFSSESVLREHIVSPEGTIFPATGTGEQFVVPEQELLQSPVRYGPVAGLSWAFQPSMGLTIMPELSVSFDVRTQPLNRAFGIGAGLAFAYDGGTPTMPSESVFRLPAPVASVRLFATDITGLRSDTARLILHPVLHRRYLPLLAVLPIGEKDTSLTEYYTFLTPAGTTLFSADETAKNSLPEFYRHTLNIIAQRLRTYSDATLLLSASTDSKVLRAHLETIRRYFTEVWEIDSTRLHIMPPVVKKSSPINGLILEASSAAVFAPIVAQWIEEEVAAPDITMEKYITAAAGIDRWQVTITQDTFRIAVFPGKGYEAIQNMSSFPLYGLHLDSHPKPLAAELVATDSIGQISTTSATLPLVVTNSDSTERRTYFFFAPLPGENTITTLNNVLLSHLLDFIDNTTNITIDPPAQSDSLWSTTFVGEKLLSALNNRKLHPTRINISSPSRLAPLSRPTPLLPAIRITAERRSP